MAKAAKATRAPRERYTVKDMATALIEARGIKSAAAGRLGCSRQTLERYIDRYPAVAEAYEQARADLIDLAENGLVTALEAGEWPAIRYTLSTLGKDRGYVERTESNTQAKLEVDTTPKRLEGFTYEELLAIANDLPLPGGRGYSGQNGQGKED